MANAKRNKPIRNKSAFDQLVLNGVDFLVKALDEFSDDPKGSVINFYTAVELFLKARLLNEHWTLVVSKDANIEKFEAGDFVSVTFDEAVKRLRDVLKSPLSEGAQKAFDKMRKHRNRMVHFYHDGVTPQQKAVIALEQLEAWLQLNRLITGEWDAVFEPFAHHFRNMDRLLVRHREYALAKFRELEATINNAKAHGVIYTNCRSCGLNAARTDSLVTWARDCRCMICNDAWNEIIIECPECNKSGTLCVESAFTCVDCTHNVEECDIFYFLDTSNYAPDDHLCGDVLTPANCDECQGYETVCEHKGKYLCVNCFSVFDELYSCEWCSSKNTGNREDSYLTGCEFCDGYSGHHADD